MIQSYSIIKVPYKIFHFLLQGCTVSSVVVEHQLKLAKEVRVMSKGNAAFSSDGPKKRAEQDQTIFRVYKGVKCFDFNKKKNLLITGGK